MVIKLFLQTQVLLALACYAYAARCRLKRVSDYPSDMVLIPPSEWESLKNTMSFDTEKGEIVRTKEDGCICRLGTMNRLHAWAVAVRGFNYNDMACVLQCSAGAKKYIYFSEEKDADKNKFNSVAKALLSEVLFPSLKGDDKDVYSCGKDGIQKAQTVMADYCLKGRRMHGDFIINYSCNDQARDKFVEIGAIIKVKNAKDCK